jgi:ATP-binding cassette subfamily B multidrug efflux pump
MRVNAWLLRPMLDLVNVLLLVAVIYSFGIRVPLTGCRLACCMPL